jgi:tRNA(fMet)-specific endonuclease VapC
MKICLDTNIYSALVSGNQDVLTVLENADEIFIPITVLGELYAGFYLGKKERQNRAELELFLSKPGIFAVELTIAIARRYGFLFNLLKKQGTPIPTNDIWISAVALEKGAQMFTMDRHFQKVPGLIFV